MADEARRPVRAGRHRDRGRRGPDDPACRVRAGRSCCRTAARRGSAPPASPSCSRARTSSSTSTRPSRCRTSRGRKATRCSAGRTPTRIVTIELLHYDEELIRSGLPIQEAVAEVVSNEPVTHDMRHLVIRLDRAERDQVLPRAVPGLRRSRTPTRAGRSRWPTRPAGTAGSSSSSRSTRTACSRTSWTRRSRKATAWRSTAPTACSPCARATTRDLMFVGGGAGMAPILSLLRSMARARDRPGKATYYYGARRRRDLCFEEELRALEGSLSDFRYIPALSEPDRRRRLGRRGRADHRRRRPTRVRPERRRRLRLRPAADGGCRDRRTLTRLGVPEQRHLLRQVHHDRRGRHVARRHSGLTQRQRKGQH